MAKDNRRLEQADPEAVRARVEDLIRSFEAELASGDLRKKVLALVPIFHSLRKLGKTLIPSEYAASARERILHYFRQYPRTVIDGDELLVVSGIQEYARRVRELRIQFGWAIASGVTIGEMRQDEDFDVQVELGGMKPSDYILLSEIQDRDAAHRWNVANAIRKEQGSVRDKILRFLRANLANEVTNEELRYVAGDKTEWARRVRELRTEQGWPIATKSTGRPDLPVGAYVLLADRQSPEHDRHVPDKMRREILRRDGYRCQECGWSHDEWNHSDPRHLELHHVMHHAKGGENEKENLKALCNVCHDNLHREQ